MSARCLCHCILSCALLGQACTQTLLENGSAPSGSSLALPLEAAGYRPLLDTTWQIQFSGELDTSVSAELFDVDLFDTSVDQINALRARGSKVICYFDTAYEAWRPDASQLEPYRGNQMQGWPGQYWLNIRAPKVIDVMQKRIALAKDKGCDGVEADDVDSIDNDPGFRMVRGEQQQFVIKLADAAHALGLAFGLKNALQDVPRLLSYSDFAINEECVRYRECDRLAPFIEAGKPVLHIEYTEGAFEAMAERVCPQAKALRFRTLIKHLDLDAARYACP